MRDWTHHRSLGLCIVHMCIQKHSCVIVGCFQCNGQSITAILQTRKENSELCKCQVVELKQTFTVLDGSRDNQPSNGLAL